MELGSMGSRSPSNIPMARFSRAASRAGTACETRPRYPTHAGAVSPCPRAFAKRIARREAHNAGTGSFVLTVGVASVSQPDGADLLERARRGDAEAVGALYEHYYAKVLKFIHYRVGPEVAEDLTADVFVRVCKGLPDQHGRFQAWLYRVAINVVRDYLRHKKVHREYASGQEECQLPTPDADPTASVRRRLDVRAALADLTDCQREFVVLKFLQGLSNEQIGRIMDRRPGALRALQFRALAALRHSILAEERS